MLTFFFEVKWFYILLPTTVINFVLNTNITIFAASLIYCFKCNQSISHYTIFILINVTIWITDYLHNLRGSIINIERLKIPILFLHTITKTIISPNIKIMYTFLVKTKWFCVSLPSSSISTNNTDHIFNGNSTIWTATFIIRTKSNQSISSNTPII